MNSGLCRGGPYNMKHLHHPGEAFNVAMTTNTRRGIVTRAQNPTRPVDFKLLYGVYRYRPEHKDWLWYPPEENSDVSGNR